MRHNVVTNDQKYHFPTWTLYYTLCFRSSEDAISKEMDHPSKPVTYTDMLQLQNQSITEIQEFTIVCGISVSLLKLMGICKNSLF